MRDVLDIKYLLEVGGLDVAELYDADVNLYVSEWGEYGRFEDFLAECGIDDARIGA